MRKILLMTCITFLAIVLGLGVMAPALAGGGGSDCDEAGGNDDNDTICNDQDNCDNDDNQDQSNIDNDEFGDVCDPDIDGDGEPNETDCAPEDDTIFPGATEIPNDGIDQDCNDAETLAESEEGFFWKEVEIGCFDGLDISSGELQSCNLWITIHDELDGTLVDTIPAHLDVGLVTEGTADCDDGVFANAHGKSKNPSIRLASATIVTCDIDPEDLNSQIHIETDTRESPSNFRSNNPNHVDKWSPTGCGLFEVNGGLIYFEEIDEITGEPIVLDSMDPVFVHTTPDDLDCDGVPNAEDICEGGDDNVDTDVDGVPDFCDVCLSVDDNADADLDGLACFEDDDDADACNPDPLNENCEDDA